MQFADHHKRFLKEIGRTDTGRNLVELFLAAKGHYSSIATIDKSRPTDSQIEGRQLFCEFMDELVKQITTQRHLPRPLGQDDFT